VLLGILIGVAGGAGGGAVAGFVLAVLTLQVKRLRNRALMARGLSGFKDCVLQIVFVPLCAIAGGVVGGAAGAFASPWHATLIGAIGPTALVGLVIIGNATLQAFRST
jgi:hypothetical protein